MNKKALLIVLTLIVALSMVALMVACDLNVDLGGGDDTGDDTPSGEEFEYKASDVATKLDAKRAGDEYLIKYTITSSEDEGSQVIGLGAKGDIYYLSYDQDQYYYDLSGDNYVVYSKSGDNDWAKDVTPFVEAFSKADAKEAMDGVINLHNAYLTQYDAYVGSMEDVTKSTDTVAGRACDKYTFKASGATIGVVAHVTYTCSVDKETSVCLKWSYSQIVNGETANYKIECTTFNLSPDFTLPTVTEENTTIHDYVA